MCSKPGSEVFKRSNITELPYKVPVPSGVSIFFFFLFFLGGVGVGDWNKVNTDFNNNNLTVYVQL